jgi:hypothetical protein
LDDALTANFGFSCADAVMTAETESKITRTHRRRLIIQHSLSKFLNVAVLFGTVE